jgi:hypothetical protein
MITWLLLIGHFVLQGIASGRECRLAMFKRRTTIWVLVTVCCWSLACATILFFHLRIPERPRVAKILLPQPGDSVGGTISIVPDLSAISSAISVKYSLDNGPPASSAGPSFRYSINTVQLSNGNHLISAVGQDAEGTQFQLPSITIDVENSAYQPFYPAVASFDTPTNMQLGEFRRIVVRVARKNVKNSSLSIDLPDAISGVISARLLTDTFGIQALSDEEQMVQKDKVTEWRWSVRAQSKGTGHLYLTLANVLRENGVVEKRDCFFLDRTITVEETGLASISSMFTIHWKDIAAWLSGLFAALLVLVFSEKIKGRFAKRLLHSQSSSSWTQTDPNSSVGYWK